MKGKAFGKEKFDELIKTHLPFLPPVIFMTYDDRDVDEVSYGDDEQYNTWDYGEIDDELELGAFIFLSKDEETSEVGVKLYYDSVAFNGTTSDDEYINTLDSVPITKFTKELYDAAMKDIMEYAGL